MLTTHFLIIGFRVSSHWAPIDAKSDYNIQSDTRWRICKGVSVNGPQNNSLYENEFADLLKP